MKFTRRHSQLRTLHGSGLSQLFCAQTQLPGALRSACGRPRTHLAKLPRGLCPCQLTSARILESLLRTLRSAFKPGLAHLRSGPTLLLQDVSKQFLFRDSLTRTAKRPCADRLRSHLLPLDIALPGDVLQRLLYGNVLVLVHKGRQHGGVVHIRAAPQSANTRPRSAEAKTACSLQRSLRSGSGSPCSGGRLTKAALACLTSNV